MRVFYRWYHPRCDGSLLVMVVYCVTWVGLTKVLSTVVVMGWFRNMTLSHIFHNYISDIFIYFHIHFSHLYSSDSVTVTEVVITLVLMMVVKAGAGAKPGPGLRSWR